MKLGDNEELKEGPATRLHLNVIKDTGRVKPAVIAARVEELRTKGEKVSLNDKFGKSWDTHWFLLQIEFDETSDAKWLEEDTEVHLLWNGSCEAAIYDTRGTRLLQAITENVREVYCIKRTGVKNDLADEAVNYTGTPNRVEYLIEMACNEMFGAPKDGFGSDHTMERMFELHKVEVAVFNRRAFSIYYNFEIIKDSAELLQKEQS